MNAHSNDELGKTSKEQRAGRWDVRETSLPNPNIADYVTSCGGLGIRVTDKPQSRGGDCAGTSLRGPRNCGSHDRWRADLMKRATIAERLVCSSIETTGEAEVIAWRS
ncbi:MAG: hypothetical protein ACI8QS_000471 [Planctomycetota bacterium]|jgi:hypothetical protein